MKTLRIATRESVLALWQAHYIQAALQQLHPDLAIEIVGMTTTGDQKLEQSLATVGGKGLFVKELEQALLDRRADIAVHSMKDVPADFPAGLELSVICERGDPRDALLTNGQANLLELPQGAVVGTSSFRRQCQIKAMRPDLNIKLLRGNVPSRIKKLEAGEYDAIVLAVAGLERLNLLEKCNYIFPVNEVLPAIGQGAIGIETRCEDAIIKDLVAPLTHRQTWQCVEAERALSHCLGGNCHTPLAGYATMQNNELTLTGLIGEPDGSQLLQYQMSGLPDKASEIGASVAENLVTQGADKILAKLQ